MPIDTSMYGNLQTPNPTAQLNNIVNLAGNIQQYKTGQIAQQQAAQTLQTGQIEQQRTGLALQSDTMKLAAQAQANQERQAVIQLTQNDPDFKPGPDGTLNTAKVMPKLMAAAPQTWNAYADNINKHNNDQTVINTNLIGLDKTTRDSLGGIAASGVKQPKSQTVAQVNEWMAANDKSPQAQYLGKQLINSLADAGDDQAKIDAVLSTAALRTKTVPEILTARQPELSLVNQGQTSQAYVSKPNFSGINPMAPVGGPISMGITPGQRETLETDPATQKPVIVTRNAAGTIIGSRDATAGGGGSGPQLTPPGATAAPTAGGPVPAAPARVNPYTRSGGFTNIPPGESVKSYGDLQQFRANTNAAAANTGQMADTIQQISNLADQIRSGTPGKVSESLARAIGYAEGGDSAANLQKMGHYLGLQSVQIANQMGLRNTDAGGQVAQQLAGKQDWDPAAIKSTAETIGAYNTGLKLYNQGQEAAISRVNGDVFQIRKFQNAWSGAFSVDAMRLYNAASQGRNEYNRVKQDILNEPNGQQAFAAAQARAGVLKQLKDGIIPQ